jgi:topoisomerase-4 subunit A
VIDVDEFIAVKGLKAKGKRLHTWDISKIEELEPLRFPEEKGTEDPVEVDDSDDEGSLVDDSGQMSLF